MKIPIRALVFKAIKRDLEKLGIVELDEKGELSWDKSGREKNSRHDFERYGSGEGEIDLSALTKKEAQALLKTFQNNSGVLGCKILAADVQKFLKASAEGVATAKARTCKQAAWMLELFLGELPHHLIFSEDNYGGDSHTAYYVDDVDYHPEVQRSHNYEKKEEYISIDLWWIEDEYRHKKHLNLYKENCLDKTPLEILEGIGYTIESPKLVEKLREETERFYKILEKIGKQYIAKGIGVADLDDAASKKSRRDDEDRWSWRSRRLKLDKFGESRVVIDVLSEKDTAKEKRSDGDSPNFYRWHKWNSRFHAPSEDELAKHLTADEDTELRPGLEIPVHPLVPCFDLRRHSRLRIHVNNLTPYQYDTSVSDRLVLPDRDWKMVNLLVDHSSNKFKDIIGNKGQSMNVLCAGSPGTGKTATAEVFAEFKKRPLYSIQCGQLGTNPEDVEYNLGVILNRANRWNAILLLDEADVYIRKRGTDMGQNAIVGAFLRVLEYASCILFMTTNLKDTVDDAVASRCIACLNYEIPSKEDQAKIWRILAKLNDISIEDKELEKITSKYKLSGRDVKNLLKLASFANPSGELTFKDIEYVTQFKPTQEYQGE